MAIQELKIFGFRSLKDATWNPGRLNLLVGANGSGKSNLIRCLELISSTAKGQLEKSLSAEGGVVPILWDHREAGTCGWKLRIDPADKPRDPVRDALTYEFELAQVGTGSAYEIIKDTLGNWYKFEQGQERSPYWLFHRDRRRANVFDQKEGKLVELQEESSDNPDGYDENESLLADQIVAVRNRIPTLARRDLEGWNVHHDVHAERGSTMRKPATTQFTKRLVPDGSNLVTVLHTLYTSIPKFKELIDEGMRAGFGDEFQELVFQPAAAQQIQLAVRWKSSSFPHAGSDLSDGTLRFLFMLTVLSHPEPPALIAIDEPEAGLHPSMLPILAEYAGTASEQTQVVLTSHSPEFLDAFTELSPRVTLCHWEDGQTYLFQLDESVLGKWLSQYRLGHIFTRGDLETLALPKVEPIDDLTDRFESLPSEDAAMAGLPGEAEEDMDG